MRRPLVKLELESFAPTERKILGRRLGEDLNNLVEDIPAEPRSTDARVEPDDTHRPRYVRHETIPKCGDVSPVVLAKLKLPLEGLVHVELRPNLRADDTDLGHVPTVCPWSVQVRAPRPHIGMTARIAASGASTVDLMKRAGHSTPAAAQRYIHAIEGRDREVANALSDIASTGAAAKLPRTIKIKP